jgi:hypothetical protein
MDIKLSSTLLQYASQTKIGDKQRDIINLLNDPSGTLSNKWKDALSKATGVPESAFSSALNFATNPKLDTGLKLANSLSPNLASSATGGLLNSTAVGGALSLLNQPLSVGSVLQTGASIAFGPVGGFVAGLIGSAFTGTTISDEAKNQSKNVAESYLDPKELSLRSISEAEQYAKNIINSNADDATKCCALDDFANRCEDMKKSTGDTKQQEAYQKLADGIKSGLNQPNAIFKGKIGDSGKIEQAFRDFKSTTLL